MEIDDRYLCYSAIMNNGVLFRDFWRPIMRKEVFYETRLYQYSEALAGSLVHPAGRGLGKSIGLEMWIPQEIIRNKKCEGILTSYRSLHTHDRMESVISFFLLIPYFKAFLADRKPINRKPVYEMRFKNGVVMYGIAIGDDPQAVNMTGKHAKFRAIEETQFYPPQAFTQFQGTEHPTGSTDRYIGVPDGQITSPFRRLDSLLGEKRLHIAKIYDPDLTMKKANKLFESYGGENSNDTLNQFWSLWGEPVSSAWDLESIKRCMILDQYSPDYKASVVEINKKDFERAEEDTDVFLYGLSYRKNVQNYYIAMDAGDNKAVILVFADYGGRYQLIERISLVDKISLVQQPMIVDYIFKFYNQKVLTYIAIDCTSADGRGIADTLTSKKPGYDYGVYKKQLYRVGFQSTYEVAVDEVGNIVKKDENTKPSKETVKEITYNTLRNLFDRRIGKKRVITLPFDTEILEDFGREMRVRDQIQKFRLKTPTDVHIPEAMRCFIYLIWLFYEKGEEMGDGTNSFVDIVWQDTPNILNRRN